MKSRRLSKPKPKSVNSAFELIEAAITEIVSQIAIEREAKAARRKPRAIAAHGTRAA